MKDNKSKISDSSLDASLDNTSLWLELENYLSQLNEFNSVDSSDDETWLNDLRSSWSNRLDDLYT